MTNGPVTSKFVPSPPPSNSQLPTSPSVKSGVWNWLTTPLVSEETADKAPEWIRPLARFGAKYFTDPLTLGITVGTAGLGGPAALGLRTAARGLPSGLRMGAKILAAGIEPVAYLPKGRAVGNLARVKQLGLGASGEIAITAGAGLGQETGEKIGGTPGAIIGGLAGGLAGASTFGMGARRVGATLQAEKTIDNNLKNLEKKTNPLSETLGEYVGPARQDTFVNNQTNVISDVQEEFDARWYARAAKKLKDFGTSKKFEAMARKPEALIKGLAKRIDPRITVNGIPEYAKVLRTTGGHTIDNLAALIQNWLNSKGTADTLFGNIDRTPTSKHGAITSGDLSPDAVPKELLGDLDNVTLQNIASNLQLKKWDDYLSPERKEYFRRLAEIEKFGLDYMKESGIDVKEINFDAFDAFGTKGFTKAQADELGLSAEDLKIINDTQYAGRGLLGKFDAEGNLISKGLQRKDGTSITINRRVSSEKKRSWESVLDAEREGYRYISYDEYAIINLKSRLKRGYDEQLLKWARENINNEELGGMKGLRITTENEELIATIDPNTLKLYEESIISARMSVKIQKALNAHLQGKPFTLSAKEMRTIATLKKQDKIFAQLLEARDSVFNKEVRSGVDNVRGIIKKFSTEVNEKLNYGNNPKVFALYTRVSQLKRLVERERRKPKGMQRLADPFNKNYITQLAAKASREGWENISDAELDKAYQTLANDSRYRQLIEQQDAYLTKEDFHGAAQQFVADGDVRTIEMDIGRAFDNYVPQSMKDELSVNQMEYLKENIDSFTERAVNESAYAKKQIKNQKDANKNIGYNWEFNKITGLSKYKMRIPKKWSQEQIDRAEEMKDDWNKIDEAMQIKWYYSKINDFNAIQRTLALAGDGSLLAIQLLALPFTHPIIAAKTGKTFFGAVLKGFLNGSNKKDLAAWHAKFITDNGDLIQRFPGLQLSTRNEFFEGLDQNGFLDYRLFEQKGFSTLKKVYKGFLTPFQDGFIAAQDFAGIEMLKALEITLPPNATAADKRSLVNFVNSMRGLSDSAAKGISQNQRALESALLLAPRYRRATMSLYALALDNTTVGGQQARKALLGLAGGMALTTVSLQIMLSAQNDESIEELESKLDDMFDPTKGSFLMITLPSDTKVGPGSKFISDFRILSKAAKAVVTDEPLQDYQNFLAADRDNPGLKWVQGQLALAPQTALDALRGTDFMGEPIYRGGLDLDGLQNFVGTPLKENTLPIWLQEFTENNSGVSLSPELDIGGRAVRAAGEFFGLRTNPKGVHNLLKEAAYIHMDKPWDKLMPFEKDILKYMLTESIAERREKQLERSTTDIQIYFNETEKLKKEFNDTMGRLAESYDIFPLTADGNRSYNFRYQNEKFAYRKEKNKLADNILFEEQDTENPDPRLRALAQYYNLFDEAENESGDFVGTIFEKNYNKLFATWTPEQRKMVKMSRYKDPIDMRVYNRLKRTNRKEAARITEAWNLRIKYFEDIGRQDLAEMERERFLKPVVPLEDR